MKNAPVCSASLQAFKVFLGYFRHTSTFFPTTRKARQEDASARYDRGI
jgi:hypothetical protein